MPASLAIVAVGQEYRQPVTSQLILIVEDDLSLRQTIDAGLVLAGFETRSVSTAEEAFDTLARESVDLILLDKVTAAALTIQVKSRTGVDDEKAQTVEFNVRLATFASRADAYVLGLLLDETGQGIRSAWLVPNTELEHVSNRKRDKLVMTPSARASSNDRYTPYRCGSLVQVCERLLATPTGRTG